jgi:hypothetical protein
MAFSMHVYYNTYLLQRIRRKKNVGPYVPFRVGAGTASKFSPGAGAA